MKRVEETIRTYLATHLTFLSEDLHLIQEEYPLPNRSGTRGFIDILAQDDNRRYVIIEVKRTNQAARQTCQEILKYAALIKHYFGVKESEIRIIIVSSEWDELIVPYSEWYRHTDYLAEGYRISLDERNIPIDKSPIVPVEEASTRNISPFQMCFLSSREETMEEMVKTIERAMTGLGLSDFVIAKLSREAAIPYPFCAYLAFQRHSKQFYLKLLRSFPQGQKSLDEYEADDAPEEQFLLSLEDMVLALVVEQVQPESLEIGNPEKFDHVVRQWQVKAVVRSGFFAKDNRLTDEMLIAELRGLRGSSSVAYVDGGLSRHGSKVKEIKENVVHSLAFNPLWKQHIMAAFSHLEKQKRECEIFVEVYCPSQILGSLSYLSKGKYEYLPTYLLVFASSEETHIYEGKIKWNGSTPLLGDILEALFPRDPFEYFFHVHLGTIGDFDARIMKRLGLEYASNRIIIRGDTTELCEDFTLIGDEEVQCSPPTGSLSIEDFTHSSGAFLEEVYDFHAQHVWGFQGSFDGSEE